jgi:hypothetical protein
MNPLDQIKIILDGKRPFADEKQHDVPPSIDPFNDERQTPILKEDRRGQYQHFGGMKVPQSFPLNKAALGVPGSGKTAIISQNAASCLERVTPHSMNCVIILDTKRDALPMATYYAAKNQVPLIMYDLNDARGWDWSLIADTQGDGDRIMEICHAFIAETKDPIWGQGSRVILSAIIKQTIHDKGLEATLYDLYETAQLPIDKLSQLLQTSPEAARYAKRLLETDATEFRDSLGMNLFIEVEALRKGALHAYECPQSRRFTISDILSQSCIVVMTCDVSVEHASFPLMRAFLTSIITQIRALPDLKYSQYPNRRISLFLDELHAIGRVPNLEKAFSTGRSKGLEVILSFHDMGQMRKVYDEATLKNMTNCLDYIAMFKCTDPETAEWFVKRGGTERINKTSQNMSHSGQGASFSEGTTSGDRTRFVTDDLLWLPKADEVEGSSFFLFHPYGMPFRRNVGAPLSAKLAPFEDKNCPIFVPKSITKTRHVRQIGCDSPQARNLENWVREAPTPLEKLIRLHALSMMNQLVDASLSDLLHRLKNEM